MKKYLLLIFIVLFTITNKNISLAQNDLTCAKSAILIETTSNRILYEKNAYEKLPMASTTKIVTALTVIENCDLEKIVEIDRESSNVEGSSIYLKQGEKLTVEDLLYGLMLRSGNDCAVALAKATAGSIEKFAVMMNGIAKKCGATNSNFTNPHGLHDKNHYTTAHDLALITAEALQNDVFKKIVSTKSTKISNNDNEHRVLVNKNKLLKSYEFADGVKTGFTKKAGRCFVGSATKNNMQLVAVVLNCGPMFENSKALLEYGFANYHLKTIIPSNKLSKITFENNIREIYYCEKSFSYPLKNSEIDQIECKVENDENQWCICVYLNKQLIFSQKLLLYNKG